MVSGPPPESSPAPFIRFLPLCFVWHTCLLATAPLLRPRASFSLTMHLTLAPPSPFPPFGPDPPPVPWLRCADVHVLSRSVSRRYSRRQTGDFQIFSPFPLFFPDGFGNFFFSLMRSEHQFSKPSRVASFFSSVFWFVPFPVRFLTSSHLSAEQCPRFVRPPLSCWFVPFGPPLFPPPPTPPCFLLLWLFSPNRNRPPGRWTRAGRLPRFSTRPAPCLFPLCYG